VSATVPKRLILFLRIAEFYFDSGGAFHATY
jgi:hypothetical protein